MKSNDIRSDAERLADELKEIHERMVETANQIRQLTEWLTGSDTDGKSSK